MSSFTSHLAPKREISDELRVFVTTWNMGNAESVGLKALLTEKKALENHDIFAIGLQESTYSSSSKKSGNFDCIAHLTAVLEATLESKFYIVEHCQRVQLQLFIFARKILKHRITNIEKRVENTGFLHVFPNKGGLLVTFNVDGTRLAFISCHLTAHEGIKHCEDRNMSIIEILGGMRAADQRFDIAEQAHHIWFMGDMNYRLTYDKRTPADTKKNKPNGHIPVDSPVESSPPEENNDNGKTKQVGAAPTRMASLTSMFGFTDSSPSKRRKSKEPSELNDVIQMATDGQSTPPLSPRKSIISETTTANSELFPSTHSSARRVSTLSECSSSASTISDCPEEKENDSEAAIPSMLQHNSTSSDLGTALTTKLSADLEDSDSESDDEEQISDRALNNKEYDNNAITKSKSTSSMSLNPSSSSHKKKLKKKERKIQMDRTFDMILEQQWETLLTLDELNREISAGRVLNGFIPLQPKFYPTFKRNRHVCIKPDKNSEQKNVFLPHSANKKIQDFYNLHRLPSYTDRILYKSMPAFKNNIQAMFFEVCENAMSSDHKPVRAGFIVKINKGSEGIMLDRNIVRWKGKVSTKTSALRTDVHMLRMKVCNLVGHNLEEMDAQIFGGGSDPYLVITTDPDSLLLYKGVFQHQIKRDLSSKIIKHDVNPIWDEDVHFSLCSIDLKGLAENASLLFSIWDYDQMNSDDLIGVVSFPLRDIIEANRADNKYTFTTVDLIQNSEIMGKLSGEIIFEDTVTQIQEWFDNIPKERHISLGSARDISALNNGCQCTVC